ncbi:MAG: hypothetical protein FD153_370 [Rhodospirillaceae bacterium]|nr:MAG: hypothetical protein FD153_370 [Rhodospirillaceae bacterium]
MHGMTAIPQQEILVEVSLNCMQKNSKRFKVLADSVDSVFDAIKAHVQAIELGFDPLDHFQQRRQFIDV